MNEVRNLQINTKSIVSITEANQNFSKVARMVDEQGIAVILKNNKPHYIIFDFKMLTQIEQSDDDKVEKLAAQILENNREAFIALE